jgi:hypothetical protein
MKKNFPKVFIHKFALKFLFTLKKFGGNEEIFLCQKSFLFQSRIRFLFMEKFLNQECDT